MRPSATSVFPFVGQDVTTRLLCAVPACINVDWKLAILVALGGLHRDGCYSGNHFGYRLAVRVRESDLAGWSLGTEAAQETSGHVYGRRCRHTCSGSLDAGYQRIDV